VRPAIARRPTTPTLSAVTWALPKIYSTQRRWKPSSPQKLRYNEFTVFEEVSSGGKATTQPAYWVFIPIRTTTRKIDPDEMPRRCAFHLTSGVYSGRAARFGIGNHGGGPLPDMFDRGRECQKQTVYPATHLAGMHEYLDTSKQHET